MSSIQEDTEVFDVFNSTQRIYLWALHDLTYYLNSNIIIMTGNGALNKSNTKLLGTIDYKR